MWTAALCLTTLMTGCQQKNAKVLQHSVTIEVPAHAVQKYVNENTYIDLDIKNLSNGIICGKQVDPDEVAQMKAATYRFYRHVRQANGIYVCALSSGEEINVSDRVFETLNKNLKELNLEIARTHKVGKSITTPEVDEDYLQSLLR